MSQKTLPINSAQPVVFVSHGSPMTALEKGRYARSLADFGKSVEPHAIVVISAHWEDPSIRITAGAHPSPIYDFGGFPRELYEVRYEAPGSPELAAQIAEHFERAGIASVLDHERGWDHGVWVPLLLMFPEATIPVVEISLPIVSPAELYRIGQTLSSLRAAGILIMGSGGIVHNLRLLNWRDKNAPADAWAREFQDWVKERIERGDHESLFDYENLAPHASRAVPTPEHFSPLFPVLGAAGGSARLEPIFEGIEHGSLSLFSFQLIG